MLTLTFKYRSMLLRMPIQSSGVAVEKLTWDSDFQLEWPELKMEDIQNDSGPYFFERDNLNVQFKVEDDFDTLERYLFDDKNIRDEHFSDDSLRNNISDIVLAVGATNSITLKPDVTSNLCEFKKGMHCSQEVVISYRNQEGQLQRHGCIKITELNLTLFKDLYSCSDAIILKKKLPKKSIVDYFKNNDVTKKRCLVRCSSEVHGIALAKKFSEISSSSSIIKKSNNVFSNFQRLDRPAGKLLMRDFIKNNGLSKFPSYKELETKAQVSLDIFNKEGYLIYCSKTILEHNITLYDSGNDLYFVKDKYLDAFGKVVTKTHRNVKRQKTA